MRPSVVPGNDRGGEQGRGEGKERETAMSLSGEENLGRKEAMKRLRAERKERVAQASAEAKEQKRCVATLLRALGDAGKTVPRVAEVTGMPSARVLWYLSALKKYGQVVEGEKDGAYFRYVSTQAPGTGQPEGLEA